MFMHICLCTCMIGGKDSLVVWQQILSQGHIPILLYCCDTLYEYEANNRIQTLINLTSKSHNSDSQKGHNSDPSSPVYIIRHDFKCDVFDKYVLSYLYPCGHPWAALVLFDSLLVRDVYMLCNIYLHVYMSMYLYKYAIRIYLDIMYIVYTTRNSLHI